MKLLVLLHLLPFAISQQSAEYYNDVWNENIKKLYTSTTQYPTRNKEFERYNPNVIPYSNTSYEYIIVGAGSSGATLAARLAEAGKSVLLLEAGGDETDFSLMPAAFVPLQLSEMNWGYRTISQENACFGCIDRKCDLSKGKVLGGTSSFNGMLYSKGDRRDYDRWEEMGNDGWSYNKIEKYFMKLENATALNLPSTTGRGLKGPYTISYNNPNPWSQDAIIDGFKQMGYSEKDYIIDTGDKVTAPTQIATRFGRRESTNQAYLKRLCKNCKTIKIQTKALVTKIIYQNDTATGVTFIHNGQLYQADTAREIIISAGTINTPQLLMLSGIGPEEELRQKQIEPKHNIAAVGKNLDDHVAVFDMQFDTNVSLPLTTLQDIFQDYAKGFGYATYAGGQVAFRTFAGTPVPDIEYIIYQPNQMIRPEWLNVLSNYAPVMKDVVYGGSNTTLMAYVFLLHGKSRGEVTLKSNNPIDFPDINPRYFSVKDDEDMLYQGVMELLKIQNTPAMQKIGTKYRDVPIKPCEELRHNERMYWDCIILHKAGGMYHQCCTARMGKDERDSVVNNKLMVHGFRNLRVVDISVLPTHVSGHLNAVAIMMGEKIADEILNNR